MRCDPDGKVSFEMHGFLLFQLEYINCRVEGSTGAMFEVNVRSKVARKHPVYCTKTSGFLRASSERS